MRVLMLGWEFPPFITGGLGTACFGLTQGLARQGAQITFVLPKPINGEHGGQGVRVVAPQAAKASLGDKSPESVASTYAIDAEGDLAGVSFKAVPSMLRSPYVAADGGVASRGQGASGGIGFMQQAGSEAGGSIATGATIDELIQEANRYAALCVDLAAGESFDVIHAHDWFTFPAAEAVAKASGKPLVLHVHSTEYDRAGESANPSISQIEKQGFAAADRLITVSYLTHSILEKRYDVSPEKIDVVHNGVDQLPPRPNNGNRQSEVAKGSKRDRVVLFLGRITMQKGPEYFVQAAKKVLEKHEHVKFLIAGSGDRMEQIIELAVREGIGNRVLFTGFLRGGEVERVYEMADVFVMPSVSEPFGIATLEAISHDVPVIISKNAGVGEVLKHALRVDFWDVEDMADKILAVLNHRPLSATLKRHAGEEVRQLTWDGAARRCLGVYEKALQAGAV